MRPNSFSLILEYFMKKILLIVAMLMIALPTIQAQAGECELKVLTREKSFDATDLIEGYMFRGKSYYKIEVADLEECVEAAEQSLEPGNPIYEDATSGFREEVIITKTKYYYSDNEVKSKGIVRRR